MDRIDLFRIFTRVVETESFTRAADLLKMPRSTISTAIQDLEIRVGTRLLARTTRSVSVTPDGAAFYEHCLRLIADVEDVESLFRQDTVSPQGIVRVNVPERIGRLVIAPALPEFLERYPGIEIELGMTDRAINLVEGGVDCVLRVGPLQNSGLIGRRIGTLPLINVASPDYLHRYGTPNHPDELMQHHIVRYASPTSGRVEDWEWVDNTVVQTTAVSGRITVNSAEASIACCLAGLGLIQIPAYDVKHHLLTGELIQVMPHWNAEPMPMTLLYPHRKHLSRRLQVFMEWLTPILENAIQ
ncbi:LysR family transcriptional regulator [Acetobacter cibinongensis]|uniref:LysR family transcriptional regulator n=1 Tax=Acetobacter cibinongensis TaxID=146475 RepID=A0A0D6N0Q0_9PROT|nr:LysR family transcriptional regulator [Acetobacter cibinongensis]GAN59587.1 transcriptional regulator LysR [Acetobacter cibinongensis]GBQ16166.1 LysR family transcriptional regulator [Acetobacter cibinongensis NRIC 0482]GEL57476.1 LysR family transcriptional regulator [Acetobacter cibinongensis]